MPGVVLIAATAIFAFNTVDFLSRPEQTKAVVIDHYFVDSGEGGVWVPVVRFADARGVEHMAKGGKGAFDSSRSRLSVGDEIDLMYDTDNPEGDFWTTSNVWSNTYMLLAASVGFTAFGLFMIKTNADYEHKRKMN